MPSTHRRRPLLGARGRLIPFPEAHPSRRRVIGCRLCPRPCPFLRLRREGPLKNMNSVRAKFINVSPQRISLNSRGQWRVVSPNVHSRMFLGGKKVKCTTLCDQIVKQQQSVETNLVQQFELLFLTAKFKDNY